MSDVSPIKTSRAELREELKEVLEKHLVNTKGSEVMAAHFINVLMAFNNHNHPSLIAEPEKVATANQRIAEGIV